MVTRSFDEPRAAHGSRILDLYGEHYDYAMFDAEPSLEYMIASVPRSGSTHLAMELWRTGVMGAPMEYPNVPYRRFMQRRLGNGDDVLAYWHAIRRIRTSPNGVFGFKLFVSDYRRLAESHPEWLPQIAPEKVVYLTRADLVAQAVSYSRALRSCRWFHDVKEWQHPVYDAEHISACANLLRFQMGFWEDVFALTGTHVHRVTYEGLSADRDDVIRGIAEFLGVMWAPRATLRLPKMHIQRDAESAEWVRRFRKDLCTDAVTTAGSVTWQRCKRLPGAGLVSQQSHTHAMTERSFEPQCGMAKRYGGNS